MAEPARQAPPRDKPAEVVYRRIPPVGSEPPTLLRRRGVGRSFSPLVETYATIPYDDIDPTLFAGLAYVAMFGMMFGDVGHGALLVAIALLLRVGRPARFAQLRSVWPFLAAAGVSAATFGLLYGEFFGPTGVVPVLWLSPLEEPLPCFDIHGLRARRGRFDRKRGGIHFVLRRYEPLEQGTLSLG